MRAFALALLLFPVVALADGMIVIPTPIATREPFPLAVKYHHVDVDIREQVARTSIDQEFFNPSTSRLEGVYIFPLPKGAVIRDFAMEIDGKIVHAELLNATKARDIYEEIVRRMRDPALLEYLGNGAFKVRIFPIEPRTTKRVKLSYSEVLSAEGGLSRYTYPLNTEKFSAAPLDDVSIRIKIESQRGLKTVFCPTHDVEIRRKGSRSAVVGFEARNTKPDTDFTLFFSADDDRVGFSSLYHRMPGEDGYFLLTVTPAYDTAEKVQPKDVTFVLDVSGSMAGDKMQQARRALRFCLANLNPEDRFEIIRFSTEAEALFGRLSSANGANLDKAREYVDGLRAIGGTNAEEALTLALRSNRESSERPRVVIFITDGKPTIGETNEDRLVRRVRDANAERLRIFTFGVGDDLNTHLLDKLTEATHAARTYVGEKEDLEVPVSLFFEKIKSPVLVDLALKFDGVRVMQTYPRDLPDLFKGSQLTLFGRYSGSGGSVTLTGTVNGKRVSIPYTTHFPARSESNEVIAPLWAAQRIGYLLDEIRLHGQEKELIEEVTDLARRFGIVTPYTSYLVLEDQRLRADFDSLQMKTGAWSVQASREVEAMKNAVNMSQVNQGQVRMQSQNIGGQTRNVMGRAVYQNGSQWVDSQAQSMNAARVNRVQFGSATYFELMKKEPEAAKFMALGRNVRFAVRNEVYEVYE